jgi:hypothetical protein
MRKSSKQPHLAAVVIRGGVDPVGLALSNGLVAWSKPHPTKELHITPPIAFLGRYQSPLVDETHPLPQGVLLYLAAYSQCHIRGLGGEDFRSIDKTVVS